MARKTLADIDPRLAPIVEEFQVLSEVRQEIAKDAYDVQDAGTQRTIDRMVATLQQYATGYITAKVGKTVVPVKIDNDFIGMNLFYLAVEIVKDLAFMDIRVAEFEFPEQLCAVCGTQLTTANVRRVGKGKRG
jgi:hypothetical protein